MIYISHSPPTKIGNTVVFENVYRPEYIYVPLLEFYYPYIEVNNTFFQLCVSNSGELDITVRCRCKSIQSRQHNCLWGIWVSIVLVGVVMHVFECFHILCKEHPLASSCLPIYLSAVLPACAHVSTWLLGVDFDKFILDACMKI